MFVRPNSILINRLRQIADGDGDLTKTLPELGTLSSLGRDEISLIALFINRFMEKTRESIAQAQTVFSRSSEITNTIKERVLNSEHATSKQAASVEALAASMEELSAASHSIKNLAQTNSAENQKVSEATRLGFDACIHAREAAQKSSQKVEDIVEALTTIKSIAEATSRLSLNANIEAARAGEHGKGFAVVANEIRELAQQVAKSVKIIEGNINDAKEATEENNTQIGKLEVVLKEVAEKISSVANNNVELADNVNSQAATIYNNGNDVTTLATLAVELSELNRKMVDVIDDMNENINEANSRLNYFRV
jgi:methyl-accepting chemotaxis protein